MNLVPHPFHSSGVMLLVHHHYKTLTNDPETDPYDNPYNRVETQIRDSYWFYKIDPTPLFFLLNNVLQLSFIFPS